jgi:hypothetical protein
MEELGVEHKGWIDLTSKEHKATHFTNNAVISSCRAMR